jgi:hypothetical protein
MKYRGHIYCKVCVSNLNICVYLNTNSLWNYFYGIHQVAKFVTAIKLQNIFLAYINLGFRYCTLISDDDQNVAETCGLYYRIQENCCVWRKFVIYCQQCGRHASNRKNVCQNSDEKSSGIILNPKWEFITAEWRQSLLSLSVKLQA